MRDPSPRQQRNVATDIKKGLKDTLSHCTMNQAHETQSTVPPTLQTPLTPTARTMQSPDLTSSPQNCDLGKKSSEKKRKESSKDAVKCLNASTIVSMTQSSDVMSSNDSPQLNNSNHAVLSRQSSHGVTGNMHFETDKKRVSSASYLHDKGFHFDEFTQDKLNCNSSNNCATKSSSEVLSPHNMPGGTSSQSAPDNSHMSRTPSTNSSLSPSSLTLEEGGEKLPTGGTRTNQPSGLISGQLGIEDFDETEIKDLTKLANTNSGPLDPMNSDLISGFNEDEQQNPGSSQGSNFMFSEPVDSITSMVSQVTTAASTSPTVTTVTSSVSVTTRTSTSMVSSISPSPFNETPTFPTSITRPPTSGSPTSTQFSPTSNGRSCLQTILGVTDTMKLQNLSQPVNSGHLPCPITTSFSSNALKSHSNHSLPTNGKNMGPPNVQQKPNMFPNSTFHNRHLRNPNVPFSSHSQHNISGISPKGQVRQNYPFNNNDMNLSSHNKSGPSFGNRNEGHSYSPTTSGPNIWPQRGPSPSQTRSPTQFNSSMYSSGSSSNINPMTGLQCTVDSIPVSMGSGSTTPTSTSSNMGPPLLSPALQGGTPPPGRIRTPSSSSNGDKRCVSADSMLPSVNANASVRTKDRPKRERTKSADAKNEEDKKDNSAPRAKRKKSRSKEDGSKNIESKTPTRTNSKNHQSALNSLLDPKNSNSSHMYVYSSQLANNAAEDNTTTFIVYHQSFVGNKRLVVSPTHSFQSDNTDPPKSTPNSSLVNMPPISGSPLTSSESILSSQSVKQEGDRFMNGNPDNKGLPPSRNPLQSPQQPSADIVSPKQKMQRQSSQQNEESLSAEQRRHREEKLGTIQRLQDMLTSNNNYPESSNAGQWDGNLPHGCNNVRGPAPKDGSQLNAEQEWNNLLQVGKHNEKVRQMPVRPPPPYQHGPGPRWPNRNPEYDMGMPISNEIPNPRYTRMPMQRPRMPSDPMVRIPGNFPQRMGFRWESGNRHPIYYPSDMGGPVSNSAMPHGPNIVGQNPPRGPGPQRGHPSEIYPFSEQLARTASLYNREPGFDPASEQSVGPRMGSPEWNPNVPFNNNLPGPENTQRLSHLPGADASPMHSSVNHPPNMDPMMLSQDPRPNGTPVTNSMDPMSTNPGMRMSGPYEMSQPRMPYSNGEPMINQMGSPPTTMRMPMHNHMGPMSGSMNDTMARRGDPRPPDIPIPRSPNYAARATMQSPNVMSSMSQRFNHPNDMPHGGHIGLMHPQQSPLTPNIPRSPNTGMLKSPMSSVPSQYGHMSQQQNSMDSSMMGPHSAGPMSGPPPDWGLSGSLTPGSRTPNVMTSQNNMSRSTSQSALSVMMNSVNNYKLSSTPLYQEAVSIKDTPNSPLINNPNEPPISHEPPPLSHNHPSGMPLSGTMQRNMPRFHGQFPGPENPGMSRMSPQSMHNRNMMGGMTPNIRNRSINPGAINNTGGQMNHNNFPPQHYQHETNFDLKTILPRKEPSQTLSYFPQNPGVEVPQMEMQPPEPQINNHPHLPSMNHRFPSMNMPSRPLTPNNHPYNHQMSSDRSPNCFPMDSQNYPGGMHPEQQAMMENYNSNPNWPDGGMPGGIRPQMMHGDPMYSGNRP